MEEGGGGGGEGGVPGFGEYCGIAEDPAALESNDIFPLPAANPQHPMGTTDSKQTRGVYA